MTPRNRISLALIVFLTVMLAACGGSTDGNNDGGGGDNGDQTDGGDDGDDTGELTDPNIRLIANTTSLPSHVDSPTNGVQLSALVSDRNNNVVQGETVQFVPDSGVVVTDGTATTNETGTASAVLHTGGDPTNRTITVTASASGASDTLDVQVTGTSIDITGPAALAFGDIGTYTVSLSRADGSAIPNQSIELSSQNNSFGQSTVTTGPGGQAQAQLTANQSGEDTLTANALGISGTTVVNIGGADFQLTSPEADTQVPLNTQQAVMLRYLNNGNPVAGATINFATSRGTLDRTTATTDNNGEVIVNVQASNAGPATITASNPASGLSTELPIQFIATIPNSLNVQANPATVGPDSPSDITAVVRDANNNLVTGAVVEFSVDDTSGGSIRDGSVTTDTRGVAATVYNSGGDSAAPPAQITAQVRGAAVSDTTEVAIGGQALRIALGTGNELEEPNTTTYRKPYSAIVTDANGNAVPDADFRLSVTPLAYQEGEKVPTDTDGDGTPDLYAPFYKVGELDPDSPAPEDFGTGCLNEDGNQNDIVDPGEDINNNGRLDPTNIVTVPNTAELDQNGAVQFDLTYPQEFSQWVKVRLRAVASVQGTESTANAVFVLPVLAEDVNDLSVSPPGETSPFGKDGDCTTIIDPDTGDET